MGMSMYCRRNQIEGQMNLRDAVKREISYKDPKSGKTYQLKSKVCSCRLIMCPALCALLVSVKAKSSQ